MHIFRSKSSETICSRNYSPSSTRSGSPGPSPCCCCCARVGACTVTGIDGRSRVTRGSVLRGEEVGGDERQWATKEIQSNKKRGSAMPGPRPCAVALSVALPAAGETAILLTPPLQPYQNACSGERGVQQNDSLADGYRRCSAAGLAQSGCMSARGSWPTRAAVGCGPPLATVSPSCTQTNAGTHMQTQAHTATPTATHGTDTDTDTDTHRHILPLPLSLPFLDV